MTTTDKRPPLHVGCGQRHTPFTNCPTPKATGADAPAQPERGASIDDQEVSQP